MGNYLCVYILMGDYICIYICVYMVMGDYLYVYILVGDYLCVYMCIYTNGWLYIFTTCLKRAKKTNNCIFAGMIPFLELKNS